MRRTGGLSKGILACVFAGALLLGGCGSDDGAELSQNDGASSGVSKPETGVTTQGEYAAVEPMAVRPGGPPSYPSPVGRPIFYKTKSITEILPEPDPLATFMAQNDKGHLAIVTAKGYMNSDIHSYIYDGTTVRDIGVPGGHLIPPDDPRYWRTTYIHGINNSGQAVGDYDGPDPEAPGAFLFDGQQFTKIETSGGVAHSINDSGKIVGRSGPKAFLYDRGQITWLPSFGFFTYPTHINNRGQIVGQSGSLPNHARAFLYDRQKMTEIGTLGTYCFVDGPNYRCLNESKATDINNKGQVVGYTTSSGPELKGYVAFVYEKGKMEILSTQYWSDNYTIGASINDSGQIVVNLGIAISRKMPQCCTIVETSIA